MSKDKGADLKKKSEEIGINGISSISNLEADIMKIAVSYTHLDVYKRQQ